MIDRPPSEIAEEWLHAWRESNTPASGPGVGDSSLDWELPRDFPELAWTCILLILEQIGRPDEDRRFSVLAAGPLEELMNLHGEAFIDRAVGQTQLDPRFALLLGGVWRSEIAESVWERMGAVATRGW